MPYIAAFGRSLDNPLGGDDLFRVYFGGADAVVGSALISVKLAPTSGRFSCSASGGAGLGQCVPTANGTFGTYSACAAACPFAPVPVPGIMVPGRLHNDTNIVGDNVGTSDGAPPPLAGLPSGVRGAFRLRRLFV